MKESQLASLSSLFGRSGKIGNSSLWRGLVSISTVAPIFFVGFRDEIKGFNLWINYYAELKIGPIFCLTIDPLGPSTYRYVGPTESG
jgi:hypothetical protein